jgi:hypothetical protein
MAVAIVYKIELVTRRFHRLLSQSFSSHLPLLFSFYGPHHWCQALVSLLWLPSVDPPAPRMAHPDRQALHNSLSEAVGTVRLPFGPTSHISRR